MQSDTKEFQRFLALLSIETFPWKAIGNDAYRLEVDGGHIEVDEHRIYLYQQQTLNYVCIWNSQDPEIVTPIYTNARATLRVAEPKSYFEAVVEDLERRKGTPPVTPAPNVPMEGVDRQLTRVPPPRRPAPPEAMGYNYGSRPKSLWQILFPWL